MLDLQMWSCFSRGIKAKSLHAKTQSSLSVINVFLLWGCRWPPMAALFFQLLSPQSGPSSLQESPRSIHMPGAWQIYFPARLVNTANSRPACVMQIAVGYRGDRRQRGIQGRVKTQLQPLLFCCKHPLPSIPHPTAAFIQLTFQSKPWYIQGPALSSANSGKHKTCSQQLPWINF